MNPDGLEQFYRAVPLGLLIFARLSGLFLAGPITGGPYAPVQVRALIAVAVTLLLTPLRVAAEPIPPVDGMYILLMAKELLVGISIGFVVNLFLQGIRFGGDLVNRHAGFSAAESFDPDTESTSSPIGDMYHIMAVIVFILLDGHQLFIAALARSYAMVPTGSFAPGPQFLHAVADASNQMYVIALALSFPVLGTVLAITVAEAVIVRAVPQINFLHFGFAVKIMASLVVLWAGVPAAVAFMGVTMAAAQKTGYLVIQTLAG